MSSQQRPGMKVTPIKVDLIVRTTQRLREIRTRLQSPELIRARVLLSRSLDQKGPHEAVKGLAELRVDIESVLHEWEEIITALDDSEEPTRPDLRMHLPVKRTDEDPGAL
jgi:hypothetical protein